MKKSFITILLCGFIIFDIFCNDDVLLKIHDREITKDEFLRIYNKNNNSNTIDNKSIEEYLELFINFKLKVIEAEELGYDTVPSFIKEFEQYRKQLVKPYLLDKDAEERLIQEAYDRMKYEVKASHILVKVGEKASPEDTLAAYNKIMSIRQRVLDGEDFSKVAAEASDDRSAQSNGGYLGSFSVFSMVYPFETGAYETPVGEISMPVRSSYGYHLIKVIDKIPARGEIKSAHIMKAVPRDASQQFKDSLKQEIFNIHERLEAGEDFAELAKKFSDDKSSGKNGGELPWIKSTDRVIESFIDACFGIEENGAYTEPFETQFGWHIAKRIDKRDIKSFDELKEDLTQKIKRDPTRSKISESTAVEKLKKEYNFIEYKSNLKYIEAIVNEDVFDNNKKWSSGMCKYDEVLFSLDGQDYTQKDFAEYIEQNQKEKSPYDISVYVEEMYKDFVKMTVLSYEESKLDEKYPEYKYLVQEYHDGILLFNLTDDMVWSKAVEDSTGLHEFFENNKDNYMWEERAEANIFETSEVTKAKELRKKLKSGNIESEEIIKSLCDTLTPDCIKFEHGLYQKNENELVDGSNWKIGTSKVISKDEKHFVVQVNKIVPSQHKRFEEAAGIITSDYQNYLDEKWIKILREKYSIKINNELLSSIK